MNEITLYHRLLGLGIIACKFPTSILIHSVNPCIHPYKSTYHICGTFGGDFNLAVQ